MTKMTWVKNQILSVLRGEAEAATVMEHHAAFTFPLARVLVMACCAACSAASFKCFSMYVWYIGCMTCRRKHKWRWAYIITKSCKTRKAVNEWGQTHILLFQCWWTCMVKQLQRHPSAYPTQHIGSIGKQILISDYWYLWMGFIRKLKHKNLS